MKTPKGNELYNPNRHPEQQTFLSIPLVRVGAYDVPMALETTTIDTPVAAMAATGTLTFAANAANTNTVTIGSTVYTFKTALSTGPAVPYEVLIGAAATDSIDNLIAAINAASGAGTTYATGTVAHPDVTAAAGNGDTMVITATVKGLVGNGIATTDALASTSAFAATATSGGVNGTPADAGITMADASYFYIAVADTTIHDTSGWKKVSLSAL